MKVFPHKIFVFTFLISPSLWLFILDERTSPAKGGEGERKVKAKIPATRIAGNVGTSGKNLGWTCD